MALHNLGVQYRHVFSCDNDRYSKRFIRKNFAPENYFDDIRHRDRSTFPFMDLYIAGFPCQSSSIGGFQKGLYDERSKSDYHVLKVIKEQKP